MEPPDQLPTRWFALRVKSRCEKAVAIIARNKGFESILPLYRTRERWSDRFQCVERPLFPGYVFCRFNPAHRLSLLTIPGVLHLVGIGKKPIPIEDNEIGAVLTALGSGLGAKPWPYPEAGQRVWLNAGPLAGLEGFLLEAHKKHFVVVSITLLRRSVAVEIEPNWVIPMNVAEK
jgi:transcription antitermination factor NusG